MNLNSALRIIRNAEHSPRRYAKRSPTLRLTCIGATLDCQEGMESPESARWADDSYRVLSGRIPHEPPASRSK
jgi:hypothetical protein